MNALNEIGQWVSEIRYKPGKELVVPDLMSRPFTSVVGKAHQVVKDPEYIPPENTLAAIEEVALNVVSPGAIAHAQKACPDVLSHKEECPSSVSCKEIQISGGNSNPQQKVELPSGNLNHQVEI